MSTRRSRVGVAGLVLLACASGSGAEAATPPVVRCLQSYGHDLPPTTCDPNPDRLSYVDYHGKVYPNSKLGFTDGTLAPPTGNIFVEGNATPGSLVALTVTDGVRTLGPFFVGTATTDSPVGPRAGDFTAEINVVALGGHRATPDGNVGDARLGPTTLTISAQASNGDGTGPVATDTIVKHAATVDDTTAPEISDEQWPPTHIDHGCHRRYTARTWNDTNDALGVPGFRFEGYSQCPWFPIAGTLRDLTEESLGTVSEISDVRIVIEKQRLGQTYLDIRHSEDSALLPEGRGEILTRVTADFSRYWYLLNIKDLPPNAGAAVGLDDAYTITVIACDAWGDVSEPTSPANASNCATSSLGDIVIYPY